VRDGRSLHALDRAPGARFELQRILVAARASIHCYEAAPARRRKDLHRQNVVDRINGRNQREAQCLHIQEPACRLRAQIPIALALRADHATDAQIPFAKRARIRSRNATHDHGTRFLAFQKSRKRVSGIHGTDSGAENRNMRTKQRPF